jgi:hypothetical protein
MNYDALVQSIVTLHREALGRAALAVNRSLILRNWMIGAYLVEFEQDGEDRATYGAGLLSRLSRDLRQHDVKGGQHRRPGANAAALSALPAVAHSHFRDDDAEFAGFSRASAFPVDFRDTVAEIRSN